MIAKTVGIVFMDWCSCGWVVCACLGCCSGVMVVEVRM